MNVKQNKLQKSQLEIEFELTAEEFQKHSEHALDHLKKHIKVDGFRPGQAPAKIVEERVGKENLLMEAGDIAVREVYPKYVLENKLEPIGQPEISIVKIAQGSPFIFKAKITVLPDLELPNYKEIAKKIVSQSAGKEISVTDQEAQDALNYLQKARAKFSQVDRPAEKGDFVSIEYQSKDLENNKLMKDSFILGEGGLVEGFEENVLGMKAEEEKEVKIKFPDNSLRKDLADKEVDFKIKMTLVQKMELPEISDEFAKALGVFDTLADLKKNIKEGMTAEKEQAEKQRKRADILEKIAEKTKLEIPEILITYEKDRLLQDLKQRITHDPSGTPKITFEEYLVSVKQTEETIKETYQKEAEKRIKNFLVLKEIGKKEDIEVSEKEVEDEVNKALKGQTLRQAQGEIDINQFREYTKGVIYNEKVFKKLEN